MRSLLALSALLTGCATVGTMQADCESKTSTFPAMAECVRKSIQSDSRMQNDGLVKLYLLKAEQLAGEVREGKTSDLQARIDLQKLYVELVGIERSGGRGYTPPKQSVTCTTYGAHTTCN